MAGRQVRNGVIGIFQGVHANPESRFGQEALDKNAGDLHGSPGVFVDGRNLMVARPCDGLRAVGIIEFFWCDSQFGAQIEHTVVGDKIVTAPESFSAIHEFQCYKDIILVAAVKYIRIVIIVVHQCVVGRRCRDGCVGDGIIVYDAIKFSIPFCRVVR